jgi:hypothetical protein
VRRDLTRLTGADRPRSEWPGVGRRMTPEEYEELRTRALAVAEELEAMERWLKMRER